MNNIKWLNGTEIVNLNYTLLKIEAILDPKLNYASKAESLHNRVYNNYLYSGESDIFNLSAYYLESVSQGHIFLDGNKRTALLACVSFLAQNGIIISSKKEKELAEITVEIATHNCSISKISQFLREISLTNLTKD